MLPDVPRLSHCQRMAWGKGRLVEGARKGVKSLPPSCHREGRKVRAPFPPPPLLGSCRSQEQGCCVQSCAPAISLREGNPEPLSPPKGRETREFPRQWNPAPRGS